MRDILSVLVSTPRFGTFLRALVATQLVDDLRGPGPFLVLAPCDAAFDSLTAERRDGLFRREQIERLIDFVELHVLPRPGLRARCRLGPPVVARHFCSNGELQVVDRLVWPWPDPEAHGRAMARSSASVLGESVRMPDQVAQ